jgi:DNA (cytosine-5)-methyltransferase 1
VRSLVLNNRWCLCGEDGIGPEQNRVRRFSFGSFIGTALNVQPWLGALDNPKYERAVVATSSKEGALAKSQQELARGSSPRMESIARRRTLPGQQPRRTLERCAELQGLPADWLARFDDTNGAPFTSAGKYRVIGNGVPLPMGRAIANAVKRAMYPDLTEASA